MYLDKSEGRKAWRQQMAAMRRAEKAGTFKSAGVGPMPAERLFSDKAGYCEWLTAKGGKKPRARK